MHISDRGLVREDLVEDNVCEIDVDFTVVVDVTVVVKLLLFVLLVVVLRVVVVDHMVQLSKS